MREPEFADKTGAFNLEVIDRFGFRQLPTGCHGLRSVAALTHGLAMAALDERLPEGAVRPNLQIAITGLQVSGGRLLMGL